MTASEPSTSTSTSTTTTTTAAAAAATTTTPPVATARDSPRGFGRVVERLRSVLRNRKSKSKAAKAGDTATSSPTDPTSTTTASTNTSAPPTQPPSTAPLATTTAITRVDRSKLFAERAQALSEKFGLTIQTPDWYATGGEALRVEKPIRMRVRRTCHICQATFGASKECLNCQHVRCGECARHPARQTDEERERNRVRVREILEDREREGKRIIAVDWRDQGREERIVLRKPNKVEGKPDLVYRKPRQRVRRTCHVCQNLFEGGSKQCTKCSHLRCTDCPRDPAKKDKYPFGYPGDEFGPSAIPVHGCHTCKAMFSAGVPDGTACKKCAHKKCPQCLRLKPQKVVPEPDPEVLKQVEMKLAALKMKA